MASVAIMNKNIDIENSPKEYESEDYTTDDEQLEQLITGQKEAAKKKSGLILGGAVSLVVLTGVLVYFSGILNSVFERQDHVVDWSTNKSIGTSLFGNVEYASHSYGEVLSGISCISGYTSETSRRTRVNQIIQNARWNSYNTMESIRKIAAFVEKRFYGSWEDKVGMVIDFLDMNQPAALTCDMYDVVDQTVYKTTYADTRKKMNVAKSLLDDAGRDDAYGNAAGYTVKEIEGMYKVVDKEIYRTTYGNVDTKVAVCKKLMRTGWSSGKVSKEWSKINNRPYYQSHDSKLQDLYWELD